ncbi:hypothetical protein C8R47DRAFT_1322728 [Mycena vitilis]|nr:hypothetical protein C8R47DRAFT_1322728 [Mycena vitilis]
MSWRALLRALHAFWRGTRLVSLARPPRCPHPSRDLTARTLYQFQRLPAPPDSAATPAGPCTCKSDALNLSPLLRALQAPQRRDSRATPTLPRIHARLPLGATFVGYYLQDII